MLSVFSTLAVCEVLVASPLTTQSPLVAALECPNCRSTDLKKIPLVYAAGVHDTRGRIFGWLLGNGLWLGRYRGTSQSRLSTMLSPPRKLPYGLPIALWLLGFFPLMVFVVRGKLSWTMGLIASVYLFLLPALPIAAFAYNSFVYRRKYAAWERTFVCQRCGTLLASHSPGRSLAIAQSHISSYPRAQD
jgi:hypothetical protein